MVAVAPIRDLIAPGERRPSYASPSARATHHHPDVDLMRSGARTRWPSAATASPGESALPGGVLLSAMIQLEVVTRIFPRRRHRGALDGVVRSLSKIEEVAAGLRTLGAIALGLA